MTVPSAPTRAPALSLRSTGHNVAAAAVRGAWRVRSSGAHHVPERGPVLLVAHHPGVADAPLLLAAAPRPVRLLLAPGAFVAPTDAVVRRLGHSAWDQDAADRAGLRTARSWLLDGEAVGAFPGVARGSASASSIRPAMAYLALVTGAPVVPVAILGSRPRGSDRDAWPALRTRVLVAFGEPAPLEPVDLYSRAAVGAAAESLRQRLSDHVRTAAARAGTVLPDDATEATVPARRSRP